MEPARSFEEVSLLVTGVQLGHTRFKASIDEQEAPPIASWRCNLTALSGLYNLYFVAYNEKIYVYEPQFPTQSLPSTPALVIESQPSSSGLRAHIDRITPHSINNLTVQILGNSEVLAVVRDDGDVEAYFTRHVHQAIKRRVQPGNTLGWNGSDVKAFFQRNVGNSAWGLAIHGAARMVAVSSNNLEITVYTFALTDGESDDTHEDITEEEPTYYSGPGPKPPPDRKRNDTRIIRNGTANIPSIAFCNTGHDPSGTWLVSTDITGLVRGWNVHTLEPGGAVLATSHPSRSSQYDADLFLSSFDRLNAGWSIMFLDPKCFRHTKRIPEALGLAPASDVINAEEAIWDASSSIGQVRRIAGKFSRPRAVDVVDGNYMDPLEGQVSRSPRLSGRRDGRALPSRAGLDSTHQNGNDSISQPNATSNADATAQGAERQESSSDMDTESEGELFDEQDDMFDEDTDMDQSGEGPTQVRFQGRTSLCSDIPCPIMQASVTSMYLLQPTQENDASGHAPIITLKDPFKQEVPAQYFLMERFERCNMHAQIPPLGVVIVSTQKGRVAILSLTQLMTVAPDDMHTRVAYKRVYGYRVDHILPLASQEAAGHRPPYPVHGIAVGPMQGTEDAPDELKRWRLVIMYQDHSVLSYEIKRAASDQVEICGVDMMI